MKRFMCIADKEDRPDGLLLSDDLAEAVAWATSRAEENERLGATKWRVGVLDTSQPHMTATELSWRIVFYRDPAGNQPT